MSWLLDPGGKSVANRAQKVVADMHSQIEKQNRHIQDLEQIVLSLECMCTGPIELEIMRLEKRKEQLQNELEATDELITKYKKNVLDSKLQVAKVLNREKQYTHKIASHNMDSVDCSTECSRSGDSLQARDLHINHSNSTHVSAKHYPSSQRGCHHDKSENEFSGDEMLEEEFELLASVKVIEPRLLFMIHRNTAEDIIIYAPPLSESDSTLTIYRIRDHTDRSSNEELSYFEKMMAYGPKVIPNHDRDEPEVREMMYSGGTVCNGSKVVCLQSLGDLIVAMELPVVQDVQIDIWKASTIDKYWATTTIEGVKFAVLERIYIISEVRWGFPTVVGIELAGRHPISGKVLTEMIYEVST